MCERERERWRGQERKRASEREKNNEILLCVVKKMTIQDKEMWEKDYIWISSSVVIHHVKLYLLDCYKLNIIVCNKTFIYTYIHIYIERDFRIRDNVEKFWPYLTIVNWPNWLIELIMWRSHLACDGLNQIVNIRCIYLTHAIWLW